MNPLKRFVSLYVNRVTLLIAVVFMPLVYAACNREPMSPKIMTWEQHGDYQCRYVWDKDTGLLLSYFCSIKV